MLPGNDPLATEEPEAPETFALPPVGGVIDERYRITRSIGAGGMGAVFEAEQLAVGRRCALKFLRTELAGRSRSAARFRREARLLGKLEHEHLTAVLDYGTFLGRSPFLVMEYLEGHTLKQVFEKQAPMPPDAALEILIQMASGMAYVHRQHVVHRDLKPSNVMLVERSDGRPWVKILDFGIARALQEFDGHLTPSGAELGTAQYMSPEQAKGSRDVDPRSDVYALGAILYEALTGAVVHPGDSYNAIIFHLLTQRHRPLKELLPACPGELNAVVERCLHRDPERRYADAGELADALGPLRKRPGHTLTAGALARERTGGRQRWRGRVSWLVAGAVVGSVGTASIGAIVLSDPALRALASSESEAEPTFTQIVELRASGADVAQPLSSVDVPQPPSGMDVPARVTPSASAPEVSEQVTSAEPPVKTSRPPERGFPPKPRTSSPTLGDPSQHAPAPSVEAGTAPATAPPLAGDSTPPEHSFPFETLNPYGEN